MFPLFSTQRVPGAFLLQYSGRGVKLTIHLDLVPRLRILGFIPPFPQYVFMTWCLQLYLSLFNIASMSATLASGLVVLY
jgi:hypothetical protein